MLFVKLLGVEKIVQKINAGHIRTAELTFTVYAGNCRGSTLEKDTDNPLNQNRLQGKRSFSDQ